MAKRLTKIYTRTGDDGTTGLSDGSRTPKDALRIDAIGEVDELNSALGLVLAEHLPDDMRASLSAVQNDLLDLGGELCLPGHSIINEGHVGRLEKELERLNSTLPPLKDFVLPGGSRAAAAAHLSRTICRRAERRLVTLARSEEVAPHVRQYLNRLSDLMFVVARALNRHAGGNDVLWQQGRSRK